MIQLYRGAAFLTALFAAVSYATASGLPIVLTFDDFNPGGSEVSIPAGYGGVSWPNNMGIWGVTEPPWNPQSPPNRVLFNLNGGSGIAESVVTFIGGPKIFDGAYFSGRHNVQFKLYSGATLVGTSSILDLGSIPTFLASGYAGPVDKVGIIGVRGQHAMDNFTFKQVPEPSTFLLIGIGAFSLLGNRRLARC